MNPYLKGLHNTIDGWREERDKEGWKLSGKARKTWEQARAFLPCRREHDADAGGDGGDDPLTQKDTPATEGTGTPEPPTTVKPMPRLVSNVKYLIELLDLEVAPR